MAQKILVIDDDSFLRDLYKDLLTTEGFSVEEASDGEEGLKKIIEGGFDLILLDIVMPKKDGLTVLSDLKNVSPKISNGPIIMLTVMGQDDFIKEALKNGAAGYIIKSALTPREVLQEVRVFLEKTPAE